MVTDAPRDGAVQIPDLGRDEQFCLKEKLLERKIVLIIHAHVPPCREDFRHHGL